jgi:hypothetical protein
MEYGQGTASKVIGGNLKTMTALTAAADFSGRAGTELGEGMGIEQMLNECPGKSRGCRAVAGTFAGDRRSS